jgi:hypothetical protein
MLIRLLLIFVFSCLINNAEAQSVTLSGNLNNSGNTALVASDLGAPLFGDDFEIANNVALYVISVPTNLTVNFKSRGFTAGGVDPYFTVFQGTGSSATYFGSNYTQAFSTGGDFDLSFMLTPGLYTIALGAFANMSFAENLGTGTLGDGFIGLGEPDLLGTYYYEIGVDLPPTEGVAIPTLTEWGMIIMSALLGWSVIYLLRRRRVVYF